MIQVFENHCKNLFLWFYYVFLNLNYLIIEYKRAWNKNNFTLSYGLIVENLATYCAFCRYFLIHTECLIHLLITWDKTCFSRIGIQVILFWKQGLIIVICFVSAKYKMSNSSKFQRWSYDVCIEVILYMKNFDLEFFF